MSYDVITSQPIVIDNVRRNNKNFYRDLYWINKQSFFYIIQGSGIVKAGFAGEEYPKVHFAN